MPTPPPSPFPISADPPLKGGAGLTRKDRERLVRRSDILAAAQTVFAEKGFAGATLEEIASLAEFGKGTLYNYFPAGKDGILFAVFDELYDDLEAIIASSFPDADLDAWREGARDRFATYITQCFEYFETRQDLFLILTKEAHRMCFSENPERLSYFVAQRVRITNALTSQVEMAIRAGAMRPLPAEAIAQMLFGNISGLQMHRAINQLSQDGPVAVSLPLDPKSSTDFLCSVLFDGLLIDQNNPTHALQ